MLKMKERVGSVSLCRSIGNCEVKVFTVFIFVLYLCRCTHHRTPVVVGSLHSLCGSWESNSLNFSGLVASTFIC